MVDEGERVAHLLAAPLAGRAGERRGGLGPPLRPHAAAHRPAPALGRARTSCFGHATVSVHFGRESSTLDLDAPAIDHARLVEAERRANRLVTENRPVEVSFEEAGSAGGLRKASAREGTLRIVTIRDLDRSACGGTHVRATGEIGPILIREVRAGEAERAAGVSLRRAGGAPGPRRPRSPRRPRRPVLRRRRRAARRCSRPSAPSSRRRSRPAASWRRALAALQGARPVRGRDARRIGSALRSWCARRRARSSGCGRWRRRVAGDASGAVRGVDGEPARAPRRRVGRLRAGRGPLLKSALEQVGGRGGGNARVGQGTAPSAAALEEAVAAIVPGRA